jgi:hypothetical protein
MKFFFSLVLLILAIVAAPALWTFVHPTTLAVPTSGLPWQVAVTPDGVSTVFDLSLTRSKISDARARFGEDMQLAVIAEPNEDGNLEAYFENVTAGFVAGKLVLTADLPVAQITAMRERAKKTEYMQGTTRKAILAEADLPGALDATIRAIAFIPAAHLDETVVVERFGPPAERIRVSDTVEHLLYPDKGLDVVIDAKGKEILQYVAPKNFDALRAPLKAQAAKG